MTQCCTCATELTGVQVICKSCFAAWPKGLTFSEYTSRPYSPEPKVIPRGIGTADDPPPAPWD